MIWRKFELLLQQWVLLLLTSPPEVVAFNVVGTCCDYCNTQWITHICTCTHAGTHTHTHLYLYLLQPELAVWPPFRWWASRKQQDWCFQCRRDTSLSPQLHCPFSAVMYGHARPLRWVRWDMDLRDGIRISILDSWLQDCPPLHLIIYCY